MPKKEMTMEVRLLLAFVLMGAVLFLTPYIYKSPEPPAGKAVEPAKSAQTPPAEAPPPAPVKPKAVPPKAAETPAPVEAAQEEIIAVETKLYRVEFSNRGATVRKWILKAYKDHAGQPLDLVNQRALEKTPLPFSRVFKTQTAAAASESALFRVERSPDNLGLTFEHSDGRVATQKTFRFEEDQYLVAVTSQVLENGVPVPHSVSWRGGFGDSTVVNPAAEQRTVRYDVANADLTKTDVGDAEDGPVSASGQFSFAGVEDNYFAAVFLPASNQAVELTTFSDQVPNAAGKEEARIGAGVGGDGTNTFTLYVGPKDFDLLQRIDPKLAQLVDWGWFGFIAKPLFLALNWTNDRLTHNYGWAIVLVTVAISTLLFPLKLTSMKSSKKMQALQPQIAAINAKYKGLPMRDPRKAEQNQEVMELYKKHGVNPVGGCLPMLLQIPFFYAFYKVLTVAIEMRGATWLWVPDLSQPETIAIRALPILLIVTQFISQKMTPSPGMDPTQQKMMLIMPLALGFMFYYFSAGLVLYWLTSNVVAIAQQWFLNRTTPAPAPVVAAPAPKKKHRN
jgi:YidC/Oxa1 family membrane protein insertase